ncbi:DUF3141 domain-containing protein [Pseudomonas aeruginosa]
MLVVDPRGHWHWLASNAILKLALALLEGHPVYFVVFDPEPVEGQTMGAVVQTWPHSSTWWPSATEASAPIVYGNCQGGWAITLALSHCELYRAALAGAQWLAAVVLQARGINPMRLARWVHGRHPGRRTGRRTSAPGDSDGAWLVQNFEALRPEGVFRNTTRLFAPGD